jgi:hypothetical protein
MIAVKPTALLAGLLLAVKPTALLAGLLLAVFASLGSAASPAPAKSPSVAKAPAAAPALNEECTRRNTEQLLSLAQYFFR